MFTAFLAFVVAVLSKLIGVVTGLVANYKTEFLFGASVALSLMFASNRVDRYLIVFTLFFAFIEGHKIGEGPY